MSDNQSQAGSCKADVLRLKELLDKLRVIVQSFLPTNATSDDFAKAFEVDWSAAYRFWSRKTPGGPIVIRAIKVKINEDELCDEIIELVERLADVHKTLVTHKVEEIHLAFDIRDAFLRARTQKDVPERLQMNSAEFSSFFGEHQPFVFAVASRARQALSGYNSQLDIEIRQILASNDWDTVRPAEAIKNNHVRPSGSGKRAKVAEFNALVDALLNHYSSKNTIQKAMPARHESFIAVASGKASFTLTERLLRRARKLHSRLPKDQVKQGKSKRNTGREPSASGGHDEVLKPQHLVGNCISAIHGILSVLKLAKPDSFTDGDQASIISLVQELMKTARIDVETMRRLQTIPDGSDSGGILDEVLSSFSSNRRS